MVTFAVGLMIGGPLKNVEANLGQIARTYTCMFNDVKKLMSMVTLEYQVHSHKRWLYDDILWLLYIVQTLYILYNVKQLYYTMKAMYSLHCIIQLYTNLVYQSYVA